MLNIFMALQRAIQIRKDERGASAVEYGLLVAAIAAAIVLIVFFLGDVVTEVFQGTCDTISTEAGTTEDCAP